MAVPVVLTEQQEAEFLANPNQCPVCKSKDIDAEKPEADGHVWHETNCSNCGASWTEIYELTSIINVTKSGE